MILSLACLHEVARCRVLCSLSPPCASGARRVAYRSKSSRASSRRSRTRTRGRPRRTLDEPSFPEHRSFVCRPDHAAIAISKLHSESPTCPPLPMVLSGYSPLIEAFDPSPTFERIRCKNERGGGVLTMSTAGTACCSAGRTDAGCGAGSVTPR